MDQTKQEPDDPKPSRAGCLSALAGILILALAVLAPILLRTLSGPYEYPSGLFSGVAFVSGFIVLILSGTRYREVFLLLGPLVVLGTWFWTLLHWTSGDDGGGMTWSLLVGGVSMAVAGFCALASIVSFTDRRKPDQQAGNADGSHRPASASYAPDDPTSP